MAANRRVHDSRHLQADCKEPRISSGTLRSVIEYGLPFLLGYFSCGLAPPLLGRDVTSVLTSSESVSARVCVCAVRMITARITQMPQRAAASKAADKSKRIEHIRRAKTASDTRRRQTPNDVSVAR